MINIQKVTVIEAVDYQDSAIQDKVYHEFLKKCYLCEGLPVQNWEIDHFYPQKHFSDKINRYENLFCICGSCNKIRPKNINSTPDTEVLNNCIDDVEQFISLDISLEDCKKAIITPNHTDDATLNQKIDNTVKLLERIYNGKGSKSEKYTCLVDDIVEDVIAFIAELNDFIANYQNTALEQIAKKRILKKLDKANQYYAFKKTAFDRFASQFNPQHP
jgi:hypothetical protein